MKTRLQERTDLLTALIGDFRGEVIRDRPTGEWRYKPDSAGVGKGYSSTWIVLGVGFRAAKRKAAEIGEQRRGII